MPKLFRTGDGEVSDTIIVALELVNNDWFKRNLIGALELMCSEENWTQVGTATVEFARDKANEMLENLEIDVLIPVMPIGVMMEWPTATPPAKWLICDGSSLLRSAYAELFAKIGTVFGAVDGTHFSLPDFRDRSGMMPGSGTVTAIGQQAGAGAHILTISQMPAHAHDFNDPGHVHTLTDPGHVHTLTDPGHTHNQDVGGADAYLATGGTGRTGYGAVTTSNTTRVVTDSNTTGASVASNTTGASVASHSTDITFHSQGSNAPHPNIHPVLGMNKIIYAGI